MNRAQRREAKRNKRRASKVGRPRIDVDAAVAAVDKLIAKFDRAAEFLDAQKVESRGRMLWDGQKMHGWRA